MKTSLIASVLLLVALAHGATAGRNRMLLQSQTDMNATTNGADTLYGVINSRPELQDLKLIIDGLVQSNSTFAPVLVDLLNGTSANGTTLFAPNNEAFRAFLADLEALNALGVLNNDTVVVAVLLTHIVPFAAPSTSLSNGLNLPALVGVNLTVIINGTSVTISSPGSNATVVTPDLGNGTNVVHIVDAVLLPAPLEGLIELFNGTNNGTTNSTSLYSQLAADGNFTTLLAAINSVSDAAANNTDLVDWRGALSNNTMNLTLFAPTDAAFAQLGDISGLTVDDLNAVLAAHVVPEFVAQLSEGQELPTLADVPVLILASSSGNGGLDIANAFTNPAPITNIRYQDGTAVAYGIETVLLPATLGEDSTTEDSTIY